jgi:hypothetical protein
MAHIFLRSTPSWTAKSRTKLDAGPARAGSLSPEHGLIGLMFLVFSCDPRPAPGVFLKHGGPLAVLTNDFFVQECNASANACVRSKMKAMKNSFFAVAVALVSLGFAQCRKSATTPSNLDLSDQSVKEVQEFIKGRWELRRISGGFCGSCEHLVAHNPYMILSADHIITGKDSTGIEEDGPISWQPATYLGGGQVFFTPSGNGLSPREIVNDTLVLQQYAADGVTYKYTRSR